MRLMRLLVFYKHFIKFGTRWDFKWILTEDLNFG